MSPSILRVRSDDKLPEQADAVIIGGGIVGVSTAYFLAQRGLSVVILEKGYIGGEQSSRNWGWCRQQNRDARELPLSGLSMRLWDEMARDIGRDLGFQRCGLYYASDDPKQLATWEAWGAQHGRPFGVRTRMLDAKEAESVMRGSSTRKWLGGVHSMDDGTADPALAAPGIAEGARAFGATIHQDCAARGLDISNGAISGVFTEKGLVRTGAVVCAGGAWASGFCRRHGISFPQASVRASVLRTPPIEGLAPALATPECTLTRRPDGGYIVAISGKGTLELTPQGLRYARDFMPMFVKRLKAVEIGVGSSFFRGPEALNRWEFDEKSPFEQIRVLDPVPDQKAINYLLDSFKRLYPALPGITVSQAWGAYIDSTPDAVPVISPVDRIQGFVLAAGFSGHGFGLGPGAGQLAASMVTGDAPPVDPTPFRYSRFGDGSKVKVGAI
ncbi:NAD(P)/FAD-dependent oxidoreductase [Variovorax sp. V15]|uniref:NAD(P)/FAD-dependent oxidoreductase n=1 Tax=unclassified Variovorax TaxID=663243 RepID=UPI0034E88AA8